MKYFLLNIFLALIWAILEGEISPSNLILGFMLGYLIIFISRRALRSERYLRLAGRVARLALYFLWQLVVANLRLAYTVLALRLNIQPRILAIPLDVSGDVPITSLANLISLTPGSISLDVSSDQRVLYVHTVYAPDEQKAIREVKDGLERRLLSLLISDKKER